MSWKINVAKAEVVQFSKLNVEKKQQSSAAQFEICCVFWLSANTFYCK